MVNVSIVSLTIAQALEPVAEIQGLIQKIFLSDGTDIFENTLKQGIPANTVLPEYPEQYMLNHSSLSLNR